MASIPYDNDPRWRFLAMVATEAFVLALLLTIAAGGLSVIYHAASGDRQTYLQTAESEEAGEVLP